MDKPDLCYLAVIVAYLAACYWSDSAIPVAIGFALGIASQWCLDWKQERRQEGRKP